MATDQPFVAPKYKKPPVVERVVTVTADVPDETFYAKFEEWKALIQPDFPDYDPIKEWNLNIEMRDNVPILSDALPEVQITHRFRRKNEKGKRIMSMRLLPKQLSLHLHAEIGTEAHQYEELHSALSQWLPLWMTTFSAKGCSEVSLDYINLLSTITTPQFVKEDGGIQLNRALTVFNGPGGRHVSIIPPYDCQMGLLIDAKRLSTFNLRIHGVQMPKFGNAVRVDFKATTTKDAPSLNGPDVLSEAHFLHTLIIEYFESVFTKEARQTFEPA